MDQIYAVESIKHYFTRGTQVICSDIPTCSYAPSNNYHQPCWSIIFLALRQQSLKTGVCSTQLSKKNVLSFFFFFLLLPNLSPGLHLSTSDCSKIFIYSYIETSVLLFCFRLQSLLLRRFLFVCACPMYRPLSQFFFFGVLPAILAAFKNIEQPDLLKL